MVWYLPRLFTSQRPIQLLLLSSSWNFQIWSAWKSFILLQQTSWRANHRHRDQIQNTDPQMPLNWFPLERLSTLSTPHCRHNQTQIRHVVHFNVFYTHLNFWHPAPPLKATVMFSKRRFGKLYFSLIISLKKTIRIIQIFTKIIESERKASILLQQRWSPWGRIGDWLQCWWICTFIENWLQDWTSSEILNLQKKQKYLKMLLLAL